MTKQRLFAIIAGSLGAAVLVVGLAIGITTGLQHSKATSDSCNGKPSVLHKVAVRNNMLRPTATYGKLCDQITFTNYDHVTREMAFGPHEEHVAYDGIAEKILNQNQSFTITLNAEGKYYVHDHNHDEAGGYFTVTK